MNADSFSKWLTIAIAASAFFQAVFAGLLWSLQYEFRKDSRRTLVAVALDVQHAPPRATVRFENASRSGVLLTRLTLVARSKGRTADPRNLDFRVSIPEYGSRVEDITRILLEAARSIDPADPVWTTGQAATVFFELTPHYIAIGKKKKSGQSVTYQVEFSGGSLDSATIKESE